MIAAEGFGWGRSGVLLAVKCSENCRTLAFSFAQTGCLDGDLKPCRWLCHILREPHGTSLKLSL